MNNKYGYAEGGFLDDGASVDPISGNEVPSGSLAEEVRDDVPAQLSEGEFVVPADVVRFIGLDKLMKMRETAKAGLANMEAEGQMGGSPAPMAPMAPEVSEMNDDMEMDALIDGMDRDDFDSSVQTFSDGGSVIPNYKDYTGRDYNIAGTPEYRMYTDGTDFKNFTFIGGKPVEPIPEGWTSYVEDGEEEEEEGQVDSVETAPVDSGDHRPTDGTAALTRDYKKNMGPDGYQADLIRSTRIRSQRINALDAMIKPNMDQEATDLMFAAMTPQAQELYNSRFKDPKGLDSYFSEGMGVADRFLLAQKTADSMNLTNGAIEQGSQYLPDGRPIEWKKMVGGIVKAFSGGIEIGVLNEFGKLLDKVTGERINTVGTTEPSAVDRPTYNQEYWSKFKGTPDELRAAQRRASQDMSGGLRGGWSINAYGNKIYKEPGTYDIWDRIAEIKDNQENTRKIKADRIAEEEAKADKAAKKLADEIALKNKEDARNNFTPTPTTPPTPTPKPEPIATPPVQPPGRTYSTVNSGGGGKGERQRDAKGNATKGGAVTSGTTGKNTTGKSFNYGGLVSPSKPKIKKMRNDPTSGLASKKKAKQKAQAKKGALAAKRT